MLKTTYDHHFKLDFKLNTEDQDSSTITPHQIIQAIRDKALFLEQDLLLSQRDPNHDPALDTDVGSPATVQQIDTDIPEYTFTITRWGRVKRTAQVTAINAREARKIALAGGLTWSDWEFVDITGHDVSKAPA